MPYAIQHKSHNECLIKYTKDKGVRRKKRVDLSLIVFAVIALLIGVDFIIVILGFFIFSVFFKKAQPVPSNYEIELNRRDNRISVRDSGQARPKSKTYPLDKFKGFGFYERPTQRNSNHPPQADLFFKFEPSKGLSRRVPIRKYSHPVTLNNAMALINEIHDWLGLANETLIIEDRPYPEEPIEEEEEIFRDFRDME